MHLCTSNRTVNRSSQFTPAAPRPSPDGARENEDIDAGATGNDTVRFNLVMTSGFYKLAVKCLCTSKKTVYSYST